LSTDALVGLLDKLTVDEDGLLKKRREVLRELMLRPELRGAGLH
jgi:hypothetical protein